MTIETLVSAAIRLSEKQRRNVGDISVETIARAAGMSRSTALRRLGGNRKTLDEELRKRGIDPSRKPSVSVRAVEAAAELLQEKGLELTMTDVAKRAECSPESLYLTFGTRAHLLEAVFSTYSPLQHVEEFFNQDHGTLEETVRAFYAEMLHRFATGPNVVPYFIAHAITSPNDSTNALHSFGSPRIVQAMGTWLQAEIDAGHIKDLPIVILVQQLMAPFLFNMMLRPGIDGALPGALPTPEDSANYLAQLFLSAVRA